MEGGGLLAGGVPCGLATIKAAWPASGDGIFIERKRVLVLRLAPAKVDQARGEFTFASLPAQFVSTSFHLRAYAEDRR